MLHMFEKKNTYATLTLKKESSIGTWQIFRRLELSGLQRQSMRENEVGQTFGCRKIYSKFRSSLENSSLSEDLINTLYRAMRHCSEVLELENDQIGSVAEQLYLPPSVNVFAEALFENILISGNIQLD